MSFEAWILTVSGLLLLMGLGAAYVRRLPVTPTMVYLGIGVLLGPLGWGALYADPNVYRTFFHRAAEITVIVSLFSVGLKLRLRFLDRRWLPSLVLAFGSMALTVGLITGIGVWGLGLPLGGAVLLGAILAPTDPVLASEVQVEHAADRDRLRLALSGEAGFNDGTAFPFVMLGLGLLGLHDLGAGGWHWWAVDVVWAIAAGLGLGAVLGYATGLLVLHLRIHRHETVAFDEYLLLGLIGFSYAAAVMVHAYGFLAVFSAGVAVRAVERHKGGVSPREAAAVTGGGAEVASNPRLGPAYFAAALLNFNGQIEHVLEVGMVLLIGSALVFVGIPPGIGWFVPVMLLVVRPLSVLPVALTRQLSARQCVGVGWFGLRGVGSIYYLMYAIERGLAGDLERRLLAYTFIVIATSIMAHGMSVRPMFWYLRGGQANSRPE